MLTVLSTAHVADLRGRWIRLRYRQSFRGQPARALLRLHRAGGAVASHVLPAAVLGSARWIGPAPSDLERLDLLADVEESGDIRIDAIEGWPPGRLVAALLARGSAGFLQLLRWPFRTPRGRMLGVQEALDVEPLHRIARFAASRSRPVDLDGIDAALAVSDPEASLDLVVVESQSDEPALRATLDTLAESAGRPVRLRVGVSDESRAEVVTGLAIARGLAGVVETVIVPSGLAAGEAGPFVARGGRGRWIGLLRPGDRLSPEAIPALLAALACDPALALVYTDSIALDADGRFAAPELKPDWSPEFLDHADYIGRLALVRADALATAAESLSPGDPSPWWTILRRVGEGRRGAEILHLRRLLLYHPSDESIADPEPVPRPAATPAPDTLTASVVIPTRDRAELLRRAVQSIRASTPAGSYELLVVDNGTEEAEALALLAELRGEADVRVIEAPGPFNFSRLVNRGVSAARADVVVLLNNDCEVLDGAWLAGLAGLATKPGVGAVGARLLYGDGTLQHAGVGIGQGGYAGHRDRALPGDHPGHLGRLRVPHEVSAVTAACLAVQRRTYLDAGGFDETFAVAFNDVDFCLRLGALGYRNLLAPAVVLRHAESASRGPDVGAKRARFLDEAERFALRWRDAIQNDPYTHPLLAIDRFADQLG